MEPNEFEKKLIDPACDLQVIARGLARIGRFGGRGRYYYPVLAHSFVVGDSMHWPWKIYGYLHDMAEILTGDVGHPFKTDDQKVMEQAVHSYMLKRLGIPYPSDSHETYIKGIISKLDRKAAAAEAFVLQLYEIVEVEGNPDTESDIYRMTLEQAVGAPQEKWHWLCDSHHFGMPALFVERCENAIRVMNSWPNTKEDE